MKWLVSLVFVLLSQVIYGQNFFGWQYNDRYFSLHAGAGRATYFGELNRPKRIQNNISQYSIGLEARLLSKISGRIQAGFYQIRCRDSWAPDSSREAQRNLSFNSNNFEISLQTIYFFKAYNGNYHRRGVIDPYVGIGLGATWFNPKTTLNGETFELRPVRTEGVSYNKVALIIPATIGIKFRLTPFMNFNVEAGYRFTLTDYLDDVSRSFPESYDNTLQEILSNRKDEVGIVNQQAYDEFVPGGDRGNPVTKDQYIFLGVQLEVFLPSAKGKMFNRKTEKI